MVIVTSRCFIKASSIHHITLEEEVNMEMWKTKKIPEGKKELKTAIARLLDSEPNCYNIIVRYVAVNPSGSSRDDVKECTITVYDKAVAEGLYKEIVGQYREQNPDELYLNKICETFLSGGDKDAN